VHHRHDATSRGSGRGVADDRPVERVAETSSRQDKSADEPTRQANGEGVCLATFGELI